MIYDLSQKKCADCPSSNPYFDGIKCTSCVSPTYYNKKSKTCDNCPEGMSYNTV
jgi:hypothetical protein